MRKLRARVASLDEKSSTLPALIFHSYGQTVADFANTGVFIKVEFFLVVNPYQPREDYQFGGGGGGRRGNATKTKNVKRERTMLQVEQKILLFF